MVKQHMCIAKPGEEGAQPLFSVIWFVQFYFLNRKMSIEVTLETKKFL